MLCLYRPERAPETLLASLPFSRSCLPNIKNWRKLRGMAGRQLQE